MSTPMRALVAVVAIATLAVGCSEETRTPTGTTSGSAQPGSAPPGDDQPSSDQPGSDQPGDGQSGDVPALTTATCWAGDLAGADPQYVLSISKEYGVTYFAAAQALAKRPSFRRPRPCDDEHAFEVYKAVAMDKVAPKVTDFSALLKTGTKAFARLSANVQSACMNKSLVEATARTGLPGAVMTPVFGDGFELDWAPPSPDQWEDGQRAYACTLKQQPVGSLLYAAVFDKDFPTSRRTCIDSKALLFVDCARRHDREQVAVINVRTAVLAGKFPGRKAILTGSDGRYVDVSPAQYVTLDSACTTFLRTVSSTRKLTGVAEIDADRWPAPDGSYPVVCEADAPTTSDSLVTQGSVFDR